MFGIIDSSEGDNRVSMPTNHSLFDRRILLDVLVNVVPIGILGFFVLLFFAYDSYPSDPVVTVIQMSLIVVPGIIVAVVTYYAVKAVTRDERTAGAEIPPGYSQADAEKIAPGDND
jgi:hypothetical protein